MLKLSIVKSLDQFTLTAELTHNQGILVMQGPSGSGKTTLLDCIAGLRQPDRGSIEINGLPHYDSEKKLNTPTRTRKIGYVFQHYALFPHLTVLQNLLYGMATGGLHTFLPPTHQQGLKYLASAPHLSQWVDAFKLSHLLSKYPSQISGGERQRVALARALATAPDLLLLDEPFSALDATTKSQVHYEFLSYSKLFSIPTLLVTHNESEAHLLGDRILHMEEGHLINK